MIGGGAGLRGGDAQRRPRPLSGPHPEPLQQDGVQLTEWKREGRERKEKKKRKERTERTCAQLLRIEN